MKSAVPFTNRNFRMSMVSKEFHRKVIRFACENKTGTSSRITKKLPF